ncbi:MAG: lipid A deacylase LpxR family protein [Bacteroidota bacterium]
MSLPKYLVFCGLLLGLIAGGMIAGGGNEARAQSGEIYSHALDLHFDNDSFTIPQIDDYYTSGLSVALRTSLPDSSGLFRFFQTSEHRLRALISHIGIAHRIYTPSSYDDANPIEFDRPYAGWILFEGGLDLFYGQRHWLSTNFDLGVVGPAARAEEVQTFMHDKLHYDLPQGWKYQIRNTPAVNLELHYAFALWDHPNAQLIVEPVAKFGTIRNYVRPGGTIRLGRLRSLFESDYSGANLSGDVFSGQPMREIYLLAGLQYEYVIYNSLIEGNFIGTPSPHTEQAEPWVRHEQYGFGFSRARMDFNMLLNRLSREVVAGQPHRFLTLRLTYRF